MKQHFPPAKRVPEKYYDHSGYESDAESDVVYSENSDEASLVKYNHPLPSKEQATHNLTKHFKFVLFSYCFQKCFFFYLVVLGELRVGDLRSLNYCLLLFIVIIHKIVKSPNQNLFQIVTVQ